MRHNDGRSLRLGHVVRDDEPTRTYMTVSAARRAMHLAVLGKTGSGKALSCDTYPRRISRTIEGFCISICTATQHHFSCGSSMLVSGGNAVT